MSTVKGLSTPLFKDEISDTPGVLSVTTWGAGTTFIPLYILCTKERSVIRYTGNMRLQYNHMFVEGRKYVIN